MPALCLWLASTTTAQAQIAPECTGVAVPANYDEARQQAHLANYFAAGFLLTPGLAAPRTSSGGAVGLELGLIPPLSCSARLVLDGTKTEDTNKSPVLPRPRVRAALPALAGVTPWMGASFLPPVPSPIGTLLFVGTELGAAWSHRDGFTVGARAHLDFARMRGEIATPANPDDPAVDDLFFANGIGVDLQAAWTFEPAPAVTIAPFGSVGFADVSTLTIVGDDLAIVQNTEAPWWGALLAGGVEARLFQHLLVGIEASMAVPIYPTAKLFIGAAW